MTNFRTRAIQAALVGASVVFLILEAAPRII